MVETCPWLLLKNPIPVPIFYSLVRVHKNNHNINHNNNHDNTTFANLTQVSPFNSPGWSVWDGSAFVEQVVVVELRLQITLVDNLKKKMGRHGCQDRK